MAVSKLYKCLLFTATFLICLGGVAVFSAGVWAAVQKVDSVQKLLGDEAYKSAAYIFIASGAIIALVSSLGCCGAWNEDKLKLGLYFIVLFCIFIVLLAGGILGFMFQDRVQDELLSKMETTVGDYGEKEYITNAWDGIHLYFKCCGFVHNTTDESYRIWEGNEHLKKDNMTVPITCCKDLEDPGPCQKDPKNFAHTKDCYIEAKGYLKKNSKIIAAIGLSIALFLIVGMVLTCCVYRSL